MPLPLLALAVAMAQTPDPAWPSPVPWREPGYNNFAYYPSPNLDRRPNDVVVDTVVVHATVIPTLDRTTAAFLRESSKVSAHYTIGRDGSIVEHVNTFFRAWHAGVSEDAQGRTNVNHYSVGIELVNLNDGKDPWPRAQVEVLGHLIGHLKRRYPLKQIVSHEFIARPPGRKSDPRNFPWHELEYLGLKMYYGKRG